MTIDDCALASRALEARLDGSGIVAPQYVLQVSSPGERQLRTSADWRRFVGEWANVLSPKHGGRFEGKIMTVEGDAGSAGEVAVLELENGAVRSGFRSRRSRRRGWRFICNRVHGTRRRSPPRGGNIQRGPGWSVPQRCWPRFASFRTRSSSIERSCTVCCRTAFMAALAKKYGPTVQAEVEIDDAKGEIRIVLLKTVVENVEDSAREISLEEAPIFDEGFEPGDVMEEPLDFTVFGRAAIQAAKQRIIQRVREGERTKHPRRVRLARRRPALRRDPADRARQARRHAQQVPRSGSDHPVPRAEPSRALPSGRADSRRAEARRGDAEGAAPHPEPRRRPLRQGAVQARGPGDPAEHRRDPRDRPRSRQPDEDRRLLARRQHRSGRRVRRPQGLARADRRQRARRRAHRHRPLVVRSGALRQAGARAREGRARVQRSA